MRLSPAQIQDIVYTARELVGHDARVWLFGSRVRDDVAGGDIDLLIESAGRVEQPVWLAAQVSAGLQRKLGERRIDVLLVDPLTPREPIHQVALAEGALLTP